MTRSVRAASAVLLALVLPACGTLVGGTRQIVRVNSDPTAAKVTTNPTTTDYVTPASISLERKNSYVLTFTKTGYSTKEVIIEKQMRGGVLVADILLFPIGVIVDAITGAWYRLTPDPMSASLAKQSAAIDGPDEIEITVRSDKGDRRQANVRLDSSAPVHVRVEKK